MSEYGMLTRRQFLHALLLGMGSMLAQPVAAKPNGMTMHPIQPASAQNMNSLSLRVLTLNIWDLPPVAKDIALRMEAIGQQLATMNLDVVGLQEAWIAADRERIAEGARAGGLTYAHYFDSGVAGSGLLILSRFPLIDAGFYRFRLGGRPEKIWEADYFGGKGVGFARVLTPIGPIDLYNTHTVAQYGRESNDENRPYNTANLYECARYAYQSNEYPVIFFGDFNVRSNRREHAIVPTLGRLRDAYSAVHPNELGPTITADNPYHTNVPPTRIDYILIRDGRAVGLEATDAEVSMQLFQPPGRSARIAYSDHYGVLVELSARDVTASANPGTAASEADAVKQALSIVAENLRLGLADVQQRQRGVQVSTLVGLASLPLVNLAGRRIESRRHFLGGVVRSAGLFAAATFTAVAGGLSVFALPDELHALTALASEVDRQLKARRAFNGIAWAE